MVFTLIPLLVAFSGQTLRDLPAWQRRHFITMRVGNVLAMAISLVIVLISVPANSTYVLMIYPIWAIVSAISFLAHATEAGMYYLVGVLLCVAALIMALTPTWAPLEVAVFMTVNAAAQAFYLRRLSSQQAEPSNARIGAAPTTIKTKASA